MTVKLITDSVADLPAEVAKELGITVVPLNVRFGSTTYRPGIDITADQFYERLSHNKVLPVTSTPAPITFAEIYDKLAQETDEILVISLSSKLSGTYSVSLKGIGLMKKKCRIELIDSRTAVMAQGLVVITAARAAQAGANFDEVKKIVHRNLPRTEIYATFDTLEYLRRGGRIGKASALLGSILKINPIIGLKDGEAVPIGRERSRAKALARLCDFVLSYRRLEELAVEYATTLDDANWIIDRLGSRFPKNKIFLSRTTPVIGTHTGPGLIIVAVLGDKK